MPYPQQLPPPHPFAVPPPFPPPPARPRHATDTADYAQPSLSAMKRDNKRKARKHFRQHHQKRWSHPGPQIPSVKRAGKAKRRMNKPGRRPGFNGKRQPASQRLRLRSATPSAFEPGDVWANGYGAIDQDNATEGVEAGLNFFGSNACMLAAAESDHASDSDSESDVAAELSEDAGVDGMDGKAKSGLWAVTVGSLEEGHGEDGARAEVAKLRETIRRQAVAIQELEVENMNLSETLSIATQELAALRSAGDEPVAPIDRDTSASLEQLASGCSVDLAAVEDPAGSTCCATMPDHADTARPAPSLPGSS